VNTALVAIAAAAIVIGALGFVAWPLISPEPEPEPGLSELDRRRLAAAERRDEAYAALRDLELDLRTGKITDEDAERERSLLRGQAAAALRELDQLDLGAQRSGSEED
jgi:hypothetical protein